MEGINKLRAMNDWFNNQTESLTDDLSFRDLVKLFDYSVKNELPYMDNDFLYSGEVTEEEQKKHYNLLKN